MKAVKDLTDRELLQLLKDGRNALFSASLFSTGKRSRTLILERMHDAQTELAIRRLNATGPEPDASRSSPTDKSDKSPQ